MRKSVITLLFLSLMWTSASADMKQVRAIEKEYEKVAEAITMAEDDEMTRNMATINVDQMWPGSGRHKEEITLYFDLETNAEGFSNRLIAAHHKYNIGAEEFELEYLFDAANASCPSLCVAKERRADCRFYFVDGKFHKRSKSKLPVSYFTNPPEILKDAARIYRIFECTIVQNH
ncbi:MAG: hypothetical protein Q4B68_08755 [Bacteroidales bacterium]|nr:hypothetical protein [Bacteroidales bacterium]